MRTKKCTVCGEMLPFSEFGNHRLSKDGKAYRCKACAKKLAKIWNDTASGIYSRLKARTTFYHKKPLNISRAEFIKWHDSQEKKCYYCDLPEDKLSLLGYPFVRRSGRLCIDCKNNDLGYQLGNLVLSCYRCNFIKSHVFTSDEMYEIGQKYLKPKWKVRVSNRKASKI